MKKEMNLCGRCISAMADRYSIAELSGRKKLDCENCGRRRYGARCAVESHRDAAEEAGISASQYRRIKISREEGDKT